MAYRERTLTFGRLQPSFLLISYLVVILGIQPVEGLYSGVIVEKALAHPKLNGDYYLLTERCNNGYQIWKQYSPKELYYIYLSQHLLTNKTEENYWRIGTSKCDSEHNYTAYNRVDGVPSYPYDLTTPWLELNSTTGHYNKTQLTVKYTYYITVGGIIGVLMGCFCFAVLLFAIFVCICSRCDRNKRRRTQPSTRAGATGHRHRRERDNSRRSEADLPPSYDSDPIYITPIAPPAYDNQPPPSYEIVELEKRLQEESGSAAPPYSLQIAVSIPLEGGATNSSASIAPVGGATVSSTSSNSESLSINTSVPAGGVASHSDTTVGVAAIESTAHRGVASNSPSLASDTERRHRDRDSDRGVHRNGVSEQSSVSTSSSQSQSVHHRQNNEAFVEDTEL